MSSQDSSSSASDYSSAWSSASHNSLTTMDLESETSRGISFKKFLFRVFRLRKGAFSKLHSRASNWTSDPSFIDKLEDFKIKAKNRDAYASASFVDAGNAALEIAMQDNNVPEERRIKLLHTGWMRADDRPPDVAIVPAGVDGSDIVRDGKFDWRRTLGTAQVWFPLESRSKKRKMPVSVGTKTDPPRKRSRSPTARDVSSSTSTETPVVAEHSDDTSTLNNRVCLAPQVSNSSSLSSSSTGVCGSRSSVSQSSSNATLCKQSAEGELVGIFSSVFASRGDRTFTIGACIYGTRIKLMLASHTGIVESDEIDFALEPELFIVFLVMFATSSLADLGFNTSTGFFNPFSPDDDTSRRVNVKFESFASDNNQKEQPDLSDIRLGPKIVSQRGLVGRATSVYRLERPGYSFGLVMKYSWQVKTHRCEDVVIRAAREADPVHTPELFGTAIVEDNSPFESLRAACLRKSKAHEPRELRVLIMREVRPLSELGFGDEFWDAYAQLLGCAHDLYRRKKILHHDISMSNLAFYRSEDGKPVAVLIDYDLATMPPVEKPKGEERVGTFPFMSRELLLKADIDYGLQHDYESFFFCAVWHGLGYEVNDKYPCKEGANKDILHAWRVGEYNRMAMHKFAFMTYEDEVYDLILDKSYSEKCVSMWRQFQAIDAAKTMEKLRRHAIDRMWKGPLSGEVPGTKVTYPMLMDALEKEYVREQCGEQCCY